MPNPIDPVCGMAVRDDENALKTEYAGQTWFFCSESCRAAFEKEPERFAVQPNVDAGAGRRTGKDGGGM